MHQCDYCGNTFSRHSTLTKHQNKAKYCKTLRLDHEISMLKGAPPEAPPLPNPPIQYIDSKTVAIELERTKTELQQLRQIINNINTTPKTPVVQNMEPVTVAHIEAMALEHLDIAVIEKGIEGIVDFTIKYPLQGRLLCTDKARRKFRYTDDQGNMINDYGGTKLSQTVFEGIEKRCIDLIDHKYAVLADNIKEAVENNKGYEDSVLASMKQSTRLQDLKNDLIDAAHGSENELQKGYIRKLVGHY